MGVLGLFSRLLTRYPSAFSKTKSSDTDKIDHVYLDGNAMLYPIAEESKDPNVIGQKLLEVATMYADTYKCICHIYIDGPAHMGKIKQQRARRFQYPSLSISTPIPPVGSRIGTYVSELGTIYSPAMFSPGTKMMEDIHTYILNNKSSYPKVCIYSSYLESYEGEHKIIRELKQIALKTKTPIKVGIVGKDADLILLCMGLIESTDKIILPYIIRHDDFSTKAYTEDIGTLYKPNDPLYHINCLSLRDLINSETKSDTIWNFIISLFLCGNDFLPPVPEMVPLFDTLPLIIQQLGVSKPLYSKNKNTGYIHIPNLISFCKSIAQIRSPNLSWIEGVTIESNDISYNIYEDFYYHKYSPFPFDSDGLNKYKDDICYSWISTVCWNMIYYHDGVDNASISWQYPGHISPSLYTLSTRLKRIIDTRSIPIGDISKKEDALSPRQALLSILPIWLHSLIPVTRYQYREIMLTLKPYYPYMFPKLHVKLSEQSSYDEPIIPIIPYEVVSKIEI